MAKCIYICFRNRLPVSVTSTLSMICQRLAPDNITPSAPVIYTNDRIAYGILNPARYFKMKDNSLLMGQFYGNYDDWDLPMEEIPDGSYALFRDSRQCCEIVSDPSGSRTIWYFLNNDMFVASTSQRAIVMYLGSFEFDERVIPWMLSTGTCGPSNSWDLRIKCVPPDSSIILDKRTWSLSSRINKIEFNQVERSEKEHELLLRRSLKETFETLKFDYSTWVLPLSGGYDSRGILLFLKETNNDLDRLKTITWGLRTSLNIKGNDATVAKQLADRIRVSNKYYTNDLTDEPIDRIVERFVRLGEGRIDHMSDYLDGFRMWQQIFEDGIEGIIRGDEAFGEFPCWSPLVVRQLEGCLLCSDLANLRDYRKYGLPEQNLPPALCRKEGESLSTWRDRIFQLRTLPVDYSALSDLKFSYVEQINPLLSRRILQQVRELPDDLRTGKILFKRIVTSMCPEVEFANSQTSTSQQEIMRQEKIVRLLKDELSSDMARKLFNSEFLECLLNGVKSKNQLEKVNVNAMTPAKLIRKIMPQFLKRALRRNLVLPSVDPNILAFRVLLVTKMNSLLFEDAGILTS